ncbi:MAG: hypothetical protein CUN54_07540 [Phototrophicales bacterium]|nr:MAG: hypothetical protein CUN54_07540 [Phototrophicales bacterium]
MEAIRYKIQLSNILVTWKRISRWLLERYYHLATTTKKKILCSMLIFLLLAAGPHLQPTEDIQLGETLSGMLSSLEAEATFAFTAEAQQTVQIELIATTDSFAAQFSITNEDGALLKALGNPTNLRMISDLVTFPEDGDYFIDVTATDQQMKDGEFIIRVINPPSNIPPMLLMEMQPAAGMLRAGNTIRFNFEANPEEALTLDVDFTETEVDGLSVELRDESDTIVALLGAGLMGGELNIPPGELAYTLELRNEQSNAVGPIGYQILLRPPSGAPIQIVPQLSESSQNESDSSEALTQSGQTTSSGAVVPMRTNTPPPPTETPIPPDTPTPSGPTPTPRVAGDNDVSTVVDFNGAPANHRGAVSSPVGDRQDTVRWRLFNLDAQSAPPGSMFRIIVTCTGPGAESVIVVFDDGSERTCFDGNAVFETLVTTSMRINGSFVIRALETDMPVFSEWEATLLFVQPSDSN